MTEKYTPKVGDKVRATLGENVLVGEVDSITYGENAGLSLDIGTLPDLFRIPSREQWQFEQVVSVPSKFGAVIRRADGVRFVLGFSDVGGGSDWWSPVVGWRPADVATAVGFTVLFDGVDE